MSGNETPEWIMLRVAAGTKGGALVDHVDGKVIDPEDCPPSLLDRETGAVMNGWGTAERTDEVVEWRGRPVRLWLVRKA